MNQTRSAHAGTDLALVGAPSDVADPGAVGLVGILDDTVVNEAVAIQLIEGLTRMEAACAAARTKVTHLLHRSRLQKVEESLPDNPSKTLRSNRIAATCRSTAAEVALARQQPPSLGHRMVEQARLLCEELPLTFAELSEGRLTQQRAGLIAEAAARLPESVRPEFDRRAALVTAGKSDARVRDALRALAYELDPAGVVARNRHDVEERFVSVRPYCEGMGRLTVVAPLAQAVAAFASLKQHADLARNLDGDTRTKAQIHCDEAISRLTCGAVQGCDADGVPLRWDGPTMPSPTFIDSSAAARQNLDAGAVVAPSDPVAEVRSRARSESTDPPEAPVEVEVDLSGPLPQAETRFGAGAFAPDRPPTDETQGFVDDVETLPAPLPRSAGASGGTDGGGEPCADSPSSDLAIPTAESGRPVMPPPVPAGARPAPQLRPGVQEAPQLIPAGARQGAPPPTPAGAPQIHLHLILTDRALLGVSNEPAELVGHGPVSADMARRLAVLGAGRADDARTTIRRYITDPVHGRLADCDPRVRSFPDVMKEFLMVRDRTCRTPWCGAPIRQYDHLDRHSDGGATTVDNGQGLCQQCNLVKESGSAEIGHWSSSRGRDGDIITTTPTGHRYVSPEPGADC